MYIYVYHKSFYSVLYFSKLVLGTLNSVKNDFTLMDFESIT